MRPKLYQAIFMIPSSAPTKYLYLLRQFMDTETIGEDDWNELQKNLEATIPVYDKINRFATLGQVSKWRRKVRERLPEEGLILEVGCGSGRYTQYFSEMSNICVSLDLSDSVFYNIYKDKKNVFAFNYFLYS